MFVPELPIGNDSLLHQTNPMGPIFENTLNLWNWPWETEGSTSGSAPKGMPADFYKTFQ